VTTICCDALHHTIAPSAASRNTPRVTRRQPLCCDALHHTTAPSAASRNTPHGARRQVWDGAAWTLKAELPDRGGRWGGPSVVHGGRMLLFGGHTDGYARVASILAYDARRDTWTTVPGSLAGAGSQAVLRTRSSV